MLDEKDTLDRLCTEIVESRKFLQEQFLALSKKYVKLEKVYDSVTNFVFIKTSLSQEIYKRLLEKSISIRYMGSYIRITAGSPEENTSVVKALDEILGDIEREDQM